MSTERFLAVAESTKDAIISCDGNGAIVFWNRAAETLFGWTREEIAGKGLTTIIPERFHDAHNRGMARARTGERRLVGRTVELFGRRRDGSEVPIELSLASHEEAGGLCFSGIIRDISERKAQERAAEERRRALEDDLNEARRFQHALVPQTLTGSHFDFASAYEPLEMVSGDFFDAAVLAPDHVRLVLVDVTGHGVQAALRTMAAKHLLAGPLREASGPAAVLEALNRSIVSLYGERSLRLVAQCAEVREDRIVLAGGAMPWPYLLDPQRGPQELQTNGPFIGVSADARFTETTTPFARGQTLLMFTDGLSEQWSDAQARLDDATFISAMNAELSPRALLDTIVARLASWRGQRGVADDLTALALRHR